MPVRDGHASAYDEREEVDRHVPREDVTIALDLQYGMEVGEVPDDVPGEVLHGEEQRDVERDGE